MNPNKFSKNLAYSSENGKYSAYNFTDGSTSFDRFEAKDESICVMPFFKNEHDKISSIVLANCSDHVSGGKNFLTCITQSHNQNKFNSFIEFLTDHWPALAGLYILFGTGFGKLVRGLLKGVTRMIVALAMSIPKIFGFIRKNKKLAFLALDAAPLVSREI